MTVERSYRVDLRRIEQDVVTELLGSGALVPDSRLQAIADAWAAFGKPGQNEMARFAELVPLLDALTEEEDVQ